MKSVLIAILFAVSAGAAQADMIRVKSNSSVPETVDKLVAAVEGAGAKVFARIDHAAGAESAGMELQPATALIFGNPKMGTPAMQASITMGLDLPMRVLTYREGDTVWMIYHDPADVAASHSVPADHEIIAKMQGALKKLTSKAAE